jgi:uncharacterized membrane protein
MTQTTQWIGPLPPPDALEQFNHIIPNGAERIFEMTLAEQRHRQLRESEALSASIADTRRGQILGGIVASLAICGAVTASYLGGNWAVSVALVSVPVMAMVKAFVDGGKLQERRRLDK